MPIPKNYPLESFPPQFGDLLTRGAKERFEVPCASPAQAYRLQVLLCRFRQRFKEKHPDHPNASLFYQAVVGLKNEGKDTAGKRIRSATVVLYPRHSEFDNILSGVSGALAAPLLESDPLADFPIGGPDTEA